MTTTMTLSRTPLLLALLPLVAAAHPADDTPAATPQTTELSTVHVHADADRDRHGTGIESYGDASLHDTPAAITVIDRRELDERHVRTLSELARGDASLGDNYAPVGYYQNIAIRGYPLDLGTGYRINNLTVPGEQVVALEGVQRVEILKGLAGIDAGVMEPGGVVNYVSKRPADVRNITLGTDSHGSRHVALDLGGWLTPNFGLRANLAWQDIHSYVEHADGRRNAYALAADWHITPATTLELDSSYQASAQNSVSGYQLLGGDTLPRHVDADHMLGAQPWQQPVRIHTATTSARLRHAFSDNWHLRLAAGHSRSVIDDNVTFAYGCYYTPACADGSHPGNYFAPDGDYDIYDYRSPDDTRTSDQARASLEGHLETGDVDHDLTFGIEAFHRTVSNRADVNEYVGSSNIHAPAIPAFPASPLEPGPSVRTFDAWQRAAFAMDRMHLGEHWQLIAGARFVRLHERTWDDDDGSAERAERLHRTLPQAAVLWQPDDALTTYVSYSEGLSLGKEAPFWTSNDGAFLGPRLSRQVETGAKYRWHDVLALGVAAYHIRQPWQHARPDATPAGYTFVQRGEEVHNGLEVSADGRLGEHLDLHASVAWIRARARHSDTPAYEGHQVVNVPRLRASIRVGWRLPWLPGLSVSGGWRYAASNPATPDGRVSAPAYHVVDAGLRFEHAVAGHDVTWLLGVDNLFNRFYWRDTGGAYGDHYLFPGAPRQARLSVNVAL